ncbi:MAG: ATPase, T2SS/T4P/T4SS family, partial [Acidobacteriota bacterium]
MNDFLRNPELDRLVEELNRSGEGEQGRGTAEARASGADHGEVLEAGQRDVRRGSSLERLLNEVARQNASDLVLVSGAPPIVRIGGNLGPVNESILDGEDIDEMFAPHLSLRMLRRIEVDGSADFSLRVGAGSSEGGSLRRFRVNVHRQRGELAAAVRSLPLQIPTLSELHLPTSLTDLVTTRQGLLLVCGPTGSGKSSTLSALVGEINRGRADHIITIEDPVEYEHRNVRSVIEQIEIGRDAPSFAAALRAALRQDPDVILVGEMRDLDTVATALSAAETGHLILSTLHTSDAEQAIHRIIDVFPPVQQGQIRHQLA